MICSSSLDGNKRVKLTCVYGKVLTDFSVCFAGAVSQNDTQVVGILLSLECFLSILSNYLVQMNLGSSLCSLQLLQEKTCTTKLLIDLLVYKYSLNKVQFSCC